MNETSDGKNKTSILYIPTSSAATKKKKNSTKQYGRQEIGKKRASKLKGHGLDNKGNVKIIFMRQI